MTTKLTDIAIVLNRKMILFFEDDGKVFDIFLSSHLISIEDILAYLVEEKL